MVSITYIPAEIFIHRLAENFKKEGTIVAPEWADYVKTSHSRENRPVQDDWFYIRAASIMRKVYMRGPIGVSRLRKPYGGKKNRGNKPNSFKLASGSVIRRILQQLEKAQFIEKSPTGKGRRITPKGQSYLDSFANEMIKEFPELEKYAT
ncbi:MAG: 30S ribosomal protein S19e [Candidatus Hodarchaeales archaeon]|jgi:small subunit ribosomal protein S19e